MYYSDKDIDIDYQQTVKMEKQSINSYDCAVVQIEPTDETLVVYNSPYAVSESYMAMAIENCEIIPQGNNSVPNNNSPNARMVSFFTAQKTKIVFYPWDLAQFTNADVFIYRIA